jgi:hypothetical protein
LVTKHLDNLQEEELARAERAVEQRRRQRAAQEEHDRARMLEDLRELDAATAEARGQLQRAEAEATKRESSAEAAEAAAAEAEERRDAVRYLASSMFYVHTALRILQQQVIAAVLNSPSSADASCGTEHRAGRINTQAQKECEEIAAHMSEQAAALDAEIRDLEQRRADLEAAADAEAQRAAKEREAAVRARTEMQAEVEAMVERHEGRARAWEERLGVQEADVAERAAAAQARPLHRCPVAL